ncbi:hypothetical protein [Streptomyces xantholiticus]|uniref:Uncharacterized protein n=1 Tax=Streptomyces xantholiticus TaxID=68285 RepID=A0ABV1UYD8_9ACTN
MVTVTHPAHPFRGRRLNVRAVRGQGLAQVLVCEGPDGGLVTVLRSWTGQLPAAPPAAGCPADCGGSRRRPGSDGGPAFRVSAPALRRLRTAVEETVGRLAGIEAPVDEHSPHP